MSTFDSLRKRLGFKPKINEQLKSLDAFSAPGLFHTGAEGSVAVPKGVAGFYTWYENDGVVFAAVNGLAEAAAGQGMYTVMPGDYEEDGEDIPEEKKLVDELGEALNFDALLPNIVKNTLIAGFCGVEIGTANGGIPKLPSKWVVKIIHPVTVKEIILEEKPTNYHGIDYIIQEANTVKGIKKPVKIEGKYLAWFVNNQIGNDPRGMSIIQCAESLLATKKTVIDKIDKILDKRLAPTIVWKSLKDITSLKEAITAREPEEDIFIGKLSPEELGDIAQVIEVKGGEKYWEYIELINRLIYVGLYAPDLYYWSSATLASAEQLTRLVDRNINAIQRGLKRGVEAGMYTRLMDLNGKEYVPRLKWGTEKTGVEDIQPAQFLSDGVNAGYVGIDQYYEILGLLGVAVTPPKPFKPEQEPQKPSPKGVPPEEEPDEEEPEERLAEKAAERVIKRASKKIDDKIDNILKGA
jgi:hypothetical protein